MDIFYTTLGTCLYLSCMARGSLTQPAHQGVINRWMTARTSSHWPQPPFQHRLYTHPSQPFRQSIAKQLTLESLLRQIYLPKEYIQCSLPVFAIMDLWLFLHMGTGCMVKHCRFKKFPKAYKIYSSLVTAQQIYSNLNSPGGPIWYNSSPVDFDVGEFFMLIYRLKYLLTNTGFIHKYNYINYITYDN